VATYLVRIELHGAAHDAPTYQTLHMRMEQVGFRRWVRFTDGTWKLPTAEYLTDDESGQMYHVRERAVTAAQGTGYLFELLVAEIVGANLCSHGLTAWR
jgi:hypothetical protein